MTYWLIWECKKAGFLLLVLLYLLFHFFSSSKFCVKFLAAYRFSVSLSVIMTCIWIISIYCMKSCMTINDNARLFMIWHLCQSYKTYYVNAADRRMHRHAQWIRSESISFDWFYARLLWHKMPIGLKKKWNRGWEIVHYVC